MNKDKFREFVKTKPELIKYIENGEMTWQKFYEIYDLYGEDESVWNKYKSDDRDLKASFGKIGDIVKNVNVDNIKSHIDTAQKAIDFVTDLTKKKTPDINNLTKGPVSPRPLNKFFED